jgi:serine/threonine protein kinase
LCGGIWTAMLRVQKVPPAIIQRTNFRISKQGFALPLTCEVGLFVHHAEYWYFPLNKALRCNSLCRFLLSHPSSSPLASSLAHPLHLLCMAGKVLRCENVPVQKILQNIAQGKYKFPDHPKISNEARDLLTKILVVDPAKRINIQQVCTLLTVKLLHYITLYAFPAYSSPARPIASRYITLQYTTL